MLQVIEILSNYASLFYEFFKIGLFSIGGGLATIPFLTNLVSTKQWFTHQQLLDMIAISESTPGPIGINMATFTGIKIIQPTGNIFEALLGGFIATIGIVTPSIIIIIIIAHFFSRFSELPVVKRVFSKIRPSVCGLIASAGFSVASVTFVKTGVFDTGSNIFETISYAPLAAFVILLFLIMKYKKSPILYLFISAIVGIVFNFK